MNAPLYIRRASEIAARRFGDELMIMSGRTSSLFNLNETASLLWQAADGVTPLQEIVERDVCGTFDIDPVTALGDARELVEALATHGILLVSDVPVDSSDTAEAST